MKSMVTAMLLIALVMFVIPTYAQGSVPPISPEAQKEKDRLLAEYDKALEFELQHGQTIIDNEDGKTRILTGESAEKMDLLWQETVRKIEAAIARPANERESVERMIEGVDGSSPVYLERFSSPYNPSAALERYQTDKYLYIVDIASSRIVDVSKTIDMNVSSSHKPSDDKLKGTYSESELENRARAFISTVDAVTDLNALQPAFNNKEGRIYFFRWEDPSMTLNDDTKPFVQVAFSSIDGSFVGYVNTLPLAMNQSQAALQKFGMMPAVVRASFNEVYANGSTNGYWAWVQNGSYANTKANDGYCYFAGWCSPKNFYWAYTEETIGKLVKGKWIPTNSSQYTRMWAWIPCNNATAYSFYKAWINNGGLTSQNVIDQEAYCSSWVLIIGASRNYTQIQLWENDIANYKVAWDEAWLCTTDVCP